MLSNDDMVIVDGVQYRPEDVPSKGSATDENGKTTKTGPVTPDDMVIVDGILYRPEDAPKGSTAGEAPVKKVPVKKTAAVTTKVARPRNKARTAPTKKG